MRYLRVGAVAVVGLTLLLPYLSPAGRAAFPLWYLSVTCAASVAAHGVGRLRGRRKCTPQTLAGAADGLHKADSAPP